VTGVTAALVDACEVTLAVAEAAAQAPTAGSGF